MEINHPHTKEWREVMADFRSDEHGLSDTEAQHRIFEVGANKLPDAKSQSIFSIFLGQFKSPLIYVLFFAAIVLLLLHENVDASIIICVLLFNALLGTFQEGRAQRTLLALKNFSETNATVIRNGREIVTPDINLVPGDLVILQEGEKVPADGRIVSVHALIVDEAALTGESIPVAKTSERLHKIDMAISERHNMVYKGTHVLSGNGTMVVTATGLSTFIGGITKTVSAVETEIPLRTDIKRLSRLIVITVSIICVSLFSFGLFFGRPIVEMFKTVVALSVSIIPEGLPIVITLVLATGVWRMSKRNVLVKKLQAVEALGQARVIAVDKTGTITKNELIVERLYVGRKDFYITGSGYEPKGEVLLDGEAIEPLNHHDVVFAAKIASLVPNARLSYEQKTSTWRMSGDPTEAAMLVFGEKLGFERELLEEEMPRVFEIPFDYTEKYHLVVNKERRGHYVTYLAGAPETILPKISSILVNGHHEKVSEEIIENIKERFLSYAHEGLRVIALAYQQGDLSPDFRKGGENLQLCFVGFLGMRDAPRPEALEAVTDARAAGMKVVMITGDHKEAARAIAKQVGIFQEGDLILSGDDVDELSEEDLAKKVGEVTVFSRVTPPHKLSIIQAYKKRGDIVAMTGDGVNDAPSLVAADLGLAMGKIGTEVAKEASDIIITDDNFGSIVAGIEEGRNIYKTIKKVILYLFSTSIGEVLVITGALFLGFPLPVLAAQIIWLNLVTDVFLDASLGMDPKEEGLLKGTFKRPGKYLVDGLMLKRMAVMAIPMTIGTLALFALYLAEEGLPKALTVSLTTLAVFQWFNAWNCRSESKSVFGKGMFSNKYLIIATLTVIGLQFLAIYTPFLQGILKTVPLVPIDFARIVSVGFSILVFEEVRKFFFRRKELVHVRLA